MALDLLKSWDKIGDSVEKPVVMPPATPPEPEVSEEASVIPEPAEPESSGSEPVSPENAAAVSDFDPAPAVETPREAVQPEPAVKAPKAPKTPKPARRVSGEPAGRIRGKNGPLPRKNIRDLPGSLVEMAVRSAGVSVSGIRAVEAFLFAYRDRSFDDEIDYSDITDDVAELAEGFDIHKKDRERDQRLARLERRIASMDKTLDSLLWAVVYLVWQATGLRSDTPIRPDEIGFNQDPQGFEETLRVLSEAVASFESDRKLREGRPIR